MREQESDTQQAPLPFDNDLIDYLLERNPVLAEECRRIRQEMQAGRFHRHEDVKRMLAGA